MKLSESAHRVWRCALPPPPTLGLATAPHGVHRTRTSSQRLSNIFISCLTSLRKPRPSAILHSTSLTPKHTCCHCQQRPQRSSSCLRVSRQTTRDATNASIALASSGRGKKRQTGDRPQSKRCEHRPACFWCASRALCLFCSSFQA